MKARPTLPLTLLCLSAVLTASCSDKAPTTPRPLPKGTVIFGGDTPEALDAVNAHWKPSFEPDYNTLAPRPGVEPATKEQTDDVSVTPTALRFPKATHPEVLAWKPGRIIVAGPGEGAGKNPLGFARRVVSVAEQGEDLVVTTETPVLQELFEGSVQMTFDPDKTRPVDLSKLDLEWAAENLYAEVDFSSELPELLRDSYPLEGGDLGEDGSPLPPARPGDPAFGWLVKAAKSVWQKVTAKSFDKTIPLTKELKQTSSNELFSRSFKKEFKPAGKLPMELALDGSGTVSSTLTFNPNLQVGFTVPGLGSIVGEKPFALWLNADSYLRATERLDIELSATLASVGGKSGEDLEELFKSAPTTREEVATQTKDFFMNHPDLKPGTAWKKTLFISKPHTQVVTAGPVPVVFTETFQLDLECGFEAKVAIQAMLALEQSLTFKYSARYEKGKLTHTGPSVGRAKRFEVQVTGGGSLIATCGLIPRLNAFIYDTVGMNAGVRASIIGRASYETSCDDSLTTWQPTGEVKLGLSLGLGLKVGARGQLPGSSFLGTSGTQLGASWYPPELYSKEFPLYEHTWDVSPGLGYCTPKCTNLTKDALETDVDCGGGQCRGCAEGKQCEKNSDCAVGFCADGKCSNTDHCRNGIIDGDETATDCGGALCGKCSVGRACYRHGDCKSNACKLLPQSGSAMGFCVADPCQDNVKDNGECAADCGGSCNACALGTACGDDAQCASGASNGYQCVNASCKDLKLSPGESDIDCGAACATGCAQGQQCFVDADCRDGSCIAGVCQDQWLSSCAQRRAADPALPDGDYTLYAGNDPRKPWTAYCKDMAGTPKEYLTLRNTTNANFSQYTAGGASPGTNLRTRFTKVRINPATLEVDPGDRTFSISTGGVSHSHATLASMPYAAAMDCVAAESTSGLANLDFTGLPFVVAPNQFALSGYLSSGTTSYGAGGRTVDLKGGGFCGWNTVAGADPIIRIKPLQLVYTP